MIFVGCSNNPIIGYMGQKVYIYLRERKKHFVCEKVRNIFPMKTAEAFCPYHSMKYL